MKYDIVSNLYAIFVHCLLNSDSLQTEVDQKVLRNIYMYVIYWTCKTINVYFKQKNYAQSCLPSYCVRFYIDTDTKVYVQHMHGLKSKI